MWTVFVFALAMLASVTPTPAHDAPHHPTKQQRLPKIAPAPAFALTSQDGTQVSLADLRGKVVAVTFIYTSCIDTCPVLTALMAHVQDKLGQDFGEKVAFISITVDMPTHSAPISKVGRSSPVTRQRFGTSPAVTASSPQRTPRAKSTTRFSRRSLTGTACCACNTLECGLIPTNFSATF
jgi:metal-sulfur cluster biosynthetic enzyme